MRRAGAALAALGLAGVLLSACGGSGSTNATTTTISTKAASREAEACQLRTKAALRSQAHLTIATSTPAFEPWFVGSDPSNGLGFESGLGYNLAARLGFPASKVQWVAMPYAGILAKGKHRFDLALAQIPGDVAHPKSLELSKPYWADPLAVVVLRSSKLGTAAWTASSTHDQGKGPLAKAEIGVVAGSTAAHYVTGTLQPSAAPKRFASLEEASKALKHGKVDAVVAALPDAWLMARNTKGARLLGTFVGSGTGFVAAVPAKGLPMGCVNAALASLREDGTTPALAKRYLAIYKR